MNGELTIQGIIKYAEAIERGVSKSGREWQKQGAVIETQERYPRTVYLTIWGDNIPSGGVLVGSLVEVAVDISSREYQGKWYTNVTAYRMRPLVPQPQTPYQAPQPPKGGVQAEEPAPIDRDGTPLPF